MKVIHLTCDGNFIVAFVAHRTLLLVGVVKRDADGGLRHTGLTVLVHQLLKVGGSHLRNIEQKLVSRFNVKYQYHEHTILLNSNGGSVVIYIICHLAKPDSGDYFRGFFQAATEAKDENYMIIMVISKRTKDHAAVYDTELFRTPEQLW